MSDIEFSDPEAQRMAAESPTPADVARTRAAGVARDGVDHMAGITDEEMARALGGESVTLGGGAARMSAVGAEPPPAPHHPSCHHARALATLTPGQQYVSDVERPDRKKGGVWTYDGPAATDGLHRFTRDEDVFIFSGDGWLLVAHWPAIGAKVHLLGVPGDDWVVTRNDEPGFVSVHAHGRLPLRTAVDCVRLVEDGPSEPEQAEQAEQPPAPHPLDALRRWAGTLAEAIDSNDGDHSLEARHRRLLLNERHDAVAAALTMAETAFAAVERERDEARAALETQRLYGNNLILCAESRAEADRAALVCLVKALDAFLNVANEAPRPLNLWRNVAGALICAEARLAGAPPPVEPATNGDKDRHEWTCLEHIADALRLPAGWGKMSLLMAVRDVVQHLRPLEGETMADASKRYVDIAEHHVEILDAAVDQLDCDKYTRIASAAEELRAEACLPRLGDTVSSYSKPDEPGVVVRLLPNEQCEIAPGAAPGLVRVEHLSSLHVIARAEDGAAPPSERPAGRCKHCNYDHATEGRAASCDADLESLRADRALLERYGAAVRASHARLCGTIDRARAEGAAAARARLVAAITGCVRIHKVGLDWIHLGEALERMGLSEAEIVEAMGAAEGSEAKPPLPVREWRAPEDDGLED